MTKVLVVGSWAFTVLFLTCACAHNPPETLARVDATEALTVPKVSAEIQAYMQRNKLEEDEIYYISASRRIGSDSTYIKVSSLVYQTQVTSLKPCALTQINKQYVLIKTGICNPDAKMDSLIDRHSKAHLIDNTRLHYRVEANGDSIILNKIVSYHPEVLYITLYRSNVIRVEISLD